MRRCLFGIEISLDWLVHSYHKVREFTLIYLQVDSV